MRTCIFEGIFVVKPNRFSRRNAAVSHERDTPTQPPGNGTNSTGDDDDEGEQLIAERDGDGDLR